MLKMWSYSKAGKPKGLKSGGGGSSLVAGLGSLKEVYAYALFSLKMQLPNADALENTEIL